MKGHDHCTTSPLTVVAARPGYLEGRFKVKEQHCTYALISSRSVNRAGTMHGGVVMTLVDSGGSLAVATNGYRNTGVSTDMNGTFVRPSGRAGDEVRVVSKVIGMGKTLAYTRTEIRDVNTDQILGMYTSKHACLHTIQPTAATQSTFVQVPRTQTT